VYLTEIRAAISAGQRPVAMLLNDPFGGHRRWWRPLEQLDPSLANVWTEWDFILLRVFQYLEDYTTQNGHPIWIEEDPDVYWEPTKTESGYERALHEYREANKLEPYEAVRMKPTWHEDAEPPSMEKWLNRLQREEETGGFDHPMGGIPRPPTPEELARLRQAAAPTPEA
jgi:hypothetical protein